MVNKSSSVTDFPVIPEQRSQDLCNLDFADRAELVLFMAGNQFMVMPELIRTFKIIHPEVQTIVYETLPPGMELKQILAGGAIFRGNTYRLQPDVYSSVAR